MRTLIIGTTVACGLFSSPAFTQQPSQRTAIPDFSGIWAHTSVYALEPPLSGPGPVRNKSRLHEGPQAGVGNNDQLV
jgi:hypothetical protein